MDKKNTPKLNVVGDKIKKEAEESLEHADALYKHVKEKANEFYEESKKTVCHAQDSVKECTDNLVQHVKEKPLTSLLIAGCIGFIISSLLKK